MGLLDEMTDDPLDDQERSRIAEMVVGYFLFELERLKRGDNREFLEAMACALRHGGARDLLALIPSQPHFTEARGERRKPRFLGRGFELLPRRVNKRATLRLRHQNCHQI
jgi:hypothetical protein